MKLRDAKVGDWVKVDGGRVKVESTLHPQLVTVRGEDGREFRLNGKLDVFPVIEARSIKVGAVTYSALRLLGHDAFACTGRMVDGETQPAKHTTLDADGRLASASFLEPYTGKVAAGTCYTFGWGQTCFVATKEMHVQAAYVFYAPASVTRDEVDVTRLGSFRHASDPYPKPLSFRISDEKGAKLDTPFDFLGRLRTDAGDSPRRKAPVTVNVADLEEGDTFVGSGGVFRYRKKLGNSRFIRDARNYPEPIYPKVRRTTVADAEPGDTIRWCVDKTGVVEKGSTVRTSDGSVKLPADLTVTILEASAPLTFGDVFMHDGCEYVMGKAAGWKLGVDHRKPGNVLVSLDGKKAIRKLPFVKPAETLPGQQLVSKEGNLWTVTRPGYANKEGSGAETPLNPDHNVLVFDGRPAVCIGDTIETGGLHFTVTARTVPNHKALKAKGRASGSILTVPNTATYEVVK